MRIAYVVGFSARIRAELDGRIRAYLQNKSVIWIRRFSNGTLDSNHLKASLLQVAEQGCTEALICFLMMRQEEYLLDSINSVIIEAKVRSKKSTSNEIIVRVELAKQPRDVEWIIGQIESFGPTVERPSPTELHGLSKWITERHPEKILLHPRAVSAAKKSQYLDIQLIYDAINLLGVEYWEMRTSTIEMAPVNHERFTARLQELSLELSKSISVSEAGKQRDGYFVTYPLGTDKKRFLEHHLKKGTDREQRLCLRIYFFWDDDLRRVVIGWLPSHLGTRDS